MTFAKPEMLWLLAATAPLLTWFLVWSWRKRQSLIRQFVQSRLLAQLTVGVSAVRQKLRLVLLGLAACLLLAALARPQLGFAWEEVRQRGLDLVIAIDTSRSMLAADVTPDRLTRSKLAALDLMKLARSDRLALVAFSGNAFLQCPLTLDDNAFQQSLNLLEAGLLPQGGTAISAAIDTALTAFKDSGDNHRALVLFTDGEDHDGDALAAANRAAAAGLKIFTVGVGTATGDRLRLVDEQGRTTYVTDESGKPVVSKLNTDLLKEVSQKTGGDFLALIGGDPMKTLYDARLGVLPKSDLNSRLLRQYHERFQWPLGLAILLLVIELFLPDRRRVNRTEAMAAAPNAELKKLFAILALLLACSPALASSQSALKAYQQGDFRAAEREYQRLAAEKPDDARLRFNAGTAAVAAGDLGAATNHLEAATRASDPALLQGVYYNLGNAFYRLGEAAGAPDLMLTNWQQSVQHYDSALRLDPKDRDAEFNRGLVQERLEELKRQMQQQQQQQSSQDSQDGKESQPQEQQSEQKPQSDSSKKDSGEPPPAPDPGDSSQDAKEKSSTGKDEETPQQPEPQPGEEQQAKPEPKPGQAKQPEPKEGADKPGKDASQAGEAAGSESTNNATASAMSAAPGQMSREQARQLLEAARMDEKAWQPIPPRDPRKINRRIRDW
jgi:Ca-activated chloride channel family protein